MAYKSSGPKGSQTAKDRKAGDVGAKGGIGGGRQGGTGNAGGGRAMGSFGGLPGQPTRDMVQRQDQIGANVSQAQRDYRDINDESWLERNLANPLAGMFGFNQMDPTTPGYSAPGMPGQTARSNWGFDPAGLVGGLAGSAFGIPLTGFLADKVSSMFGRPFEVNMGADVFGGSAPKSSYSPFGGSQSAGGYSPFGGTRNNQWAASKPQSFAQTQQPKAPVTSSLPTQSKFSGFPDYGSYSPFSNSKWSWG